MIKDKITLSRKKLEIYLSKGMEIELEICDENGKIVDRTNLLKQTNNKNDIMNDKRNDIDNENIMITEEESNVITDRDV
ncbi:unnamed protein product [Rhizophagus irregularis]|nr:unnamed protein product [Rhizophagus irregularis]